MTTATAIDELVDALTVVAENNFFAWVESCPAAEFDERARGAGGGWLSGTVTFRGPSAGTVAVTVPAPLAEEWCAQFAGTDASEPSDAGQVRDLVGEAANMVCGAWLTRRCSDAAFALTAPVVQTLATEAVLAGRAAGGGDVIGLLVNDQPVVLFVRLAHA